MQGQVLLPEIKTLPAQPITIIFTDRVFMRLHFDFLYKIFDVYGDLLQRVPEFMFLSHAITGENGTWQVHALVPVEIIRLQKILKLVSLHWFMQANVMLSYEQLLQPVCQAGLQ